MRQSCLALFAVLLAACSSSPSPAQSGSAVHGAEPGGQPPAVDAAGAQARGEAGCPADIHAAAGAKCEEEGKVCGVVAANAAQGFSNIIRCAGGTWQKIEVPPPPPPGN